MPGLYGMHRRRIDSAGRIVMPKEYRERFAGEFYIVESGSLLVAGNDGKPLDEVSPNFEYLCLYGKDGFESLSERATGHHVSVFSVGVHYKKSDSEGRISLPIEAVQYADLASRDISIIGAGERIEIWNSSAFEAFKLEAISGAK